MMYMKLPYTYRCKPAGGVAWASKGGLYTGQKQAKEAPFSLGLSSEAAESSDPRHTTRSGRVCRPSKRL